MYQVISEIDTIIDSKENPYLNGLHAPVSREVVATDLEVIGEVPRDLTGIYCRNGPNQRHTPIGMHHWFDGDGMVHAVSVRDGKVEYRNRWVETRARQIEDSAGRAVYPGLAQMPDRSLAELWGSDRSLKDNSNTDVILYNGKLVTLFYQCGDGYLLDPTTLETIGKVDLEGLGLRSLSAHSLTDENTGELVFFDYATQPPYMSYGVLNADGSLRHYTPVDLPGPRLPHTLAITEHYTILMDLPLFWDPDLLQKDIHKVTFYRDLPSRFGIVGRYAGGDSIRWFECDPTYIYHIVNAWEEGDEIVMDACKTHTPEPGQPLPGRYGNLQAWLKIDPTYFRWRFNLKTGAISEEPRFDIESEFPMINGRYYGRKSRYSYHISFDPGPVLKFDGLVKYDVETGETQQFKYGPGRFGSETPFAPRDNSQGEDDGYVVTLIDDSNTGCGEFLIFDATDISRGPLARVLLPVRIPGGFHSCWAPGDLLAHDVAGWSHHG